VIWIRVHVEHVCVSSKRAVDRVDRPAVPPFREVRHRLERQLHRTYSKNL
jgi:hypothetical protein